MTSDPTFDMTEMELTTTPPPMDNDEKTEPTRGGSSPFRPVETEICVKWTFHSRNASTALAPISASHCNALQLLLSHNPKTLTIIDNKKEQHQDLEALIAHPGVHSNKFTIRRVKSKNNNNNNNIRFIICHRIIISTSFNDIKRSPGLAEYLRDNKMYLHLHDFHENTWDTAAIGFMFNVHVQHVIPSEAKAQLDSFLKLKGLTCAPFSVNRTKIVNGNGPADRTIAYEVRCPRSDLLQVRSAVQKATSHTTIFMSHYMKKKNPEIYSSAIRIQNKCLSDTWVLKVSGLNTDAMEHLKMKLSNIPGFIATTKTNKYESTGQWKILVSETLFRSFYAQVQSNWYTFIANIPPSVLDRNPSHFPEPEIDSRNPGQDSGDSTDAGSYETAMSTIIGSYSVNDMDDNITIPPEYDTGHGDTFSVPDIRSDVSGQTNPQSDPSQFADFYNQIAELQHLIQRQQRELEAQQAEIRKLRGQSETPNSSQPPSSSSAAPTKPDSTDELSQVHHRLQRIEEMFQVMMVAQNQQQGGYGQVGPAPPPITNTKTSWSAVVRSPAPSPQKDHSAKRQNIGLSPQRLFTEQMETITAVARGHHSTTHAQGPRAGRGHHLQK